MFVEVIEEFGFVGDEVFVVVVLVDLLEIIFDEGVFVVVVV